MELPTAAKHVRQKAQNLLNSLSSEQLKLVQFPFNSPLRYVWEYTPVEQQGLMLGDMDQSQRGQLAELLESFMGRAGTELAFNIIQHELLLAEWEAIQGITDRSPIRSPDRYWLQLYGEPNENSRPWGIRFCGHHLAIHVTVVGEKVSLFPSFAGANPAEVRHGHRAGFKLLRAEEEVARRLLATFTAEQSEIAAHPSAAPSDILTRNYARTDDIPVPKGIEVGALRSEQTELLKALLNVYLKRIDAADGKIEARGIDRLGFVWVGSRRENEPHYYALYSPDLLIEYDNSQNNANHIHTVMRSRSADWGEDLLALHYRREHKRGGPPSN